MDHQLAKMSEGTGFLDLPTVHLEKIFSYLSYDDIARKREVCKTFNQVASVSLSRGFLMLKQRHDSIFRRIKDQLPRREYARKLHPLADCYEVLKIVGRRFDTLNGTYTKYIECGMFCFIPGKVLDEIKKVLLVVENHRSPAVILNTPIIHGVLQEIRDLSIMATEHFNHKILPIIEQVIQKPASTTISLKSKPIYSLSDQLYKMKNLAKTQKHHITYLTRCTQKMLQKLKIQNIRLKKPYQKLKGLDGKIIVQDIQLELQEISLVKFKKSIDEMKDKLKNLTLKTTPEDKVKIIGKYKQQLKLQRAWLDSFKEAIDSMKETLRNLTLPEFDDIE